MKGHGFSEEDWEYADYWHGTRCNHLAEQTSERSMMDTQELIRHLELEYFGIQEANPEWECELWDFLVSRKVSPEDIWTYSPDIGHLAGQPEPEWL